MSDIIIMASHSRREVHNHRNRAETTFVFLFSFSFVNVFSEKGRHLMTTGEF